MNETPAGRGRSDASDERTRKVAAAAENPPINTDDLTPELNTPGFDGSMQKILSENLGEYVLVDFLIGTDNLTRKEGVLYTVGIAYLVLFEPVSNTYVVCDIYSVKFVTFLGRAETPPASTGNLVIRK